nr:unnamed protein product [Callosobruchus analis]
MTPQLPVPNPKSTRLLYCNQAFIPISGLFQVVHRWGFQGS